MATAAVGRVSVSVEKYLNTSFRPDRDYVDGELEVRHVGEDIHSAWQFAVQLWSGCTRNGRCSFGRRYGSRWGRGGTAWRTSRSWTRQARDPVVLQAPLAVFEVVSRLDRWSRIMARLADFEAMGVPQIWVLDPKRGAMHRYVGGLLEAPAEFVLEEQRIRFAMDEVRRLVR